MPFATASRCTFWTSWRQDAVEDSPEDIGFEAEIVEEDGSSGDTADTPDSSDGGIPACTSDEECTFGEQWCVGGDCVPCDNSGTACRILCDNGWRTYSRHGCSPCECAPTNACESDDTCETDGDVCYAGDFCWDWCPEGDPSCCRVCGCPKGQSCLTNVDVCASSGCSCNGTNWLCFADCIKVSCM